MIYVRSVEKDVKLIIGDCSSLRGAQCWRKIKRQKKNPHCVLFPSYKTKDTCMSHASVVRSSLRLGMLKGGIMKLTHLQQATLIIFIFSVTSSKRVILVLYSSVIDTILTFLLFL